MRTITITTVNYSAMLSFYRDTLNLNSRHGDVSEGIWFADFGVEIYLAKTTNAEEVGVRNSLVFYSSDLGALSAGLAQRGITNNLSTAQGRGIITFSDPDDNSWTVQEKIYQGA